MKTKSNLSFRTTAGRFILLRSLIATLCAIVFTACEQTMMLNEENGDASALQIGANVARLTKATDAGFEINDTLGLYAVKWQDATTPDTLRSANNHADNVWFRLESNVENWKPEHTVYFPADNNKMDLYAYYPYRTPAFGNGTKIAIQVAPDQSAHPDYTRSDFMAAKTVGVKRTPNKVLLNFEHKLSQIVFVLKPGTGFSADDLMGAEVTVVNAITDATYDLAAMNTTPTEEPLATRTVPVAGSSRADITPYGTWQKQGDTTLTGKVAILVPQTLGANTYIQLMLGTRKFTFKPDNVNLNSGCSRRFTLTLSNTGLDITTVIIPWDNCPPVTGEAEEEFELDTIVTMTTAKQSVSFTIERNSDITVDWGDGTKEKNVFHHRYADTKEHIIRFYGEKTALTKLDCRLLAQLTTLNVSKCTALKTLWCSSNQLTILDVSDCSALKTLLCSSNKLTTLDVSGCIALTILDCGNNQLAHLDVNKCTDLINLNCSSNLLTYLNVNECKNLTDLKCPWNLLTSLEINGCKALTNLNCDSNLFTTLNISESTNLTTVVCDFNAMLTDLNVEGCKSLTNLRCANNLITNLNINGCTALENLICFDNQLATLNVSECIVLKTLDCYSNPFITDSTQMTAFANSLPDRTGKESGALQIKDTTAATQIKSVTDAKNWVVE